FVMEIPLPPLFVNVMFVKTQLSEPAKDIPVPPLLFTVTFVNARLSAPQLAMIPNVPASKTVMLLMVTPGTDGLIPQVGDDDVSVYPFPSIVRDLFTVTSPSLKLAFILSVSPANVFASSIALCNSQYKKPVRTFVTWEHKN